MYASGRKCEGSALGGAPRCDGTVTTRGISEVSGFKGEGCERQGQRTLRCCENEMDEYKIQMS